MVTNKTSALHAAETRHVKHVIAKHRSREVQGKSNLKILRHKVEIYKAQGFRNDFDRLRDEIGETPAHFESK